MHLAAGNLSRSQVPVGTAPDTLRLGIAQCSAAGPGKRNQDFHGALFEAAAVRPSRGVAIALADGIGSSPIGQLAAREAVEGFLDEYRRTADCRSVRNAGRDVIELVNSRLYALTRESCAGEDVDCGYVCTFSALVIRERHAHLFHIGDSRSARIRDGRLDVLTRDHHVVASSGERQLSRALGMRAEVDVDVDMLELASGDVFVLTSDGVHEHVSPADIVRAIAAHASDLDGAAHALLASALAHGSEDDRTVAIVRVEALPVPSSEDLLGQADDLPLPPMLDPPTTFDGYRVLRCLHANHRSHIHLARDEQSGKRVVLKLPAADLAAEPVLLGHFMREEWIARRVSSPHLVQAFETTRTRHFTYLVGEFVEGVTLRQWMLDHPRPGLAGVRDIAAQIIEGLRALHRTGMVHRDLRPENVMLDGDGTVKIIDFGSVYVPGLADATITAEQAVLGTHQYTAPECLAGETASPRSDLFSLGVMLYEMLVGRLPYGADAGRVRTRKQQNALRYRSVLEDDAAIPPWIDGALARALHRDPLRRHDALSEFITDLRRPNPRFVPRHHRPLAERDPVLFWKAVSAILAATVIVLLARIAR